MSHMVIYAGADGQRVHHPAESLEEAVRHVEQLRNSGAAGDVRIFRMVEVPIEVKTYYRVEVAAAAVPAEKVEAPAAPAPAPAAASAQPAPAAAPAPAAQPAQPAPAAPAGAVKGEPVSASNGGRFGLFSKG